MPLVPIAACGLVASGEAVASRLGWGAPVILALGLPAAQASVWWLAPGRQGTFYLALALFAATFWVLMRREGSPGTGSESHGSRVGLTILAGLTGYGVALVASRVVGGHVLWPEIKILSGLAAALCASYGVFRSRFPRSALVGAFGIIAPIAVLLWTTQRALQLDWVTFDTSWAPSTLQEVTETIQAISDADDPILSGAVVWGVEAGRPVFANLSHPLGLRSSPSGKQLIRLESELLSDPPQLVVLDGYTERTINRTTDVLTDLLTQRYELVERYEGSRFPVELYRLAAATEPRRASPQGEGRAPAREGVRAQHPIRSDSVPHSK